MKENEPNDSDELTASEQKWWRELKSVLRRMPASIELNACVGRIGISRAVSKNAAIRDHGIGYWQDHLNQIESLRVQRLDGRDDQT